MSVTISIILPTYNGSRYIQQSIDSCLQQSFSDFELIIVNDCSTDNTLSIVEEYAQKDKRVRIISNEKNLRLPLSLNKGFDAASGKYFTWTSDDNYYAPNALQTLYDYIQQQSDVDLVYANYTLVNDENKILGTKTFNNVYDSFHYWLGCGACFLYKREIHTTLKGYNPSFFLIEDYEFFLRAYTKFKFLYINRTDLYYYREHDASLTGNYGSAVNDISKIVVERMVPDLVKVLSPKEIALLYRKLAVFAAVQKNDTKKMSKFLKLLASVSKKQLFITMMYIPIKKTLNTLIVSWSTFTKGVQYFFSSDGTTK